MKTTFKLPSTLLSAMRGDLARPHAFAHERVGFLTAGATGRPDGSIMLFAREYQAVADEDYIDDPSVGAQIGAEAFARGLQLAYRPRSALFHVHTHGGRGVPSFSGVDLSSGAEFVPGFFNAVGRYPHGLLLLSDDAATALIWLDPKRSAYARTIVIVGAPQRKFGDRS